MITNNISALPIEYNYDNVISFEVIKEKQKEKEVKYNRDGSIKKIVCNKVSGVDSEVYAFRTKEEIAAMLKVLDSEIEKAKNEERRQVAHRNKLLFLIGINIGIRASDLRTLRWSFFLKKNEKDNNKLEFKTFYVLQPMKQKKQKKFVKLFFNDAVKKAIYNYISVYPIENLNDYLFFSMGNAYTSENEEEEPIEAKHLWRIIKNTALKAGIKQNIGSHSLRKTFGFWAWHEAEDKNKALVTLQAIFNHSSVQTTCKYIGLMDDEMSNMYNSINLGIDLI